MTFDDGPDPTWTPRVLEALRNSGARATFFLVAPLALRLPYLVSQTIEGGHAVELHCAKHIRHTELTRAQVEDEARAGLQDLRTLGVRPRLWRPPWGVVAPWTGAVADDLGLEVVTWTVDTHDWRGDDASEMLARTRSGLRPGAVILMHDGLGPGARRPGCEETVALVGNIVGYARSLGCEPRPIWDPMLGSGPYEGE